MTKEEELKNAIGSFWNIYEQYKQETARLRLRGEGLTDKEHVKAVEDATVYVRGCLEAMSYIEHWNRESGGLTAPDEDGDVTIETYHAARAVLQMLPAIRNSEAHR